MIHTRFYVHHIHSNFRSNYRPTSGSTSGPTVGPTSGQTSDWTSGGSFKREQLIVVNVIWDMNFMIKVAKT